MEDHGDTTGWYDDTAATFGDRLQAAREQAGLSVTDLAGRLGVKRETIAAWENDLKEPRANRLSMLSGILGISLSWLMTGEGEGPDGPLDQEALPRDVTDILAQIRATRVEMTQASEKLARLEKQLRRTLLA